MAINNIEVLRILQGKTRDLRTKTRTEIKMEKVRLLITLLGKIFQNTATNVVRVII